MKNSTYKRATAEDWELSGPRVWPVLQAGHIVDRYIHRRPELGYVRTIRGILDGRPTPDILQIRTTVAVIRYAEKKRTRVIGSFVHSVNLDDPLLDVQSWLSELRSYLQRNLPNEPDPSLSVRLIWWDASQPRPKQNRRYFQDSWL